MSVLAEPIPVTSPMILDRVDVEDHGKSAVTLPTLHHLQRPSTQPRTNNNNAQAQGPLPQMPDADFRCGICNKTYSRRDLRDRHRRRCIKTVGQERVSKRKSCETCAQKKLRCSMTRPACSRCVQSRTRCNYPPTSVPANPAAAAIAAAQRNSDACKAGSSAYSSSSSASPRSGSGSGSGSSHGSMAGLDSGVPGSLAAMLGDIRTCVGDAATRSDEQGHSKASKPKEASSSGLDPLSTSWSPIPSSNTIDLMLRPLTDNSLFPAHDLPSVGSLPWNDDLTSLSEHISSGNSFPEGLGDHAGEPPLFMSLQDIVKNPLSTIEPTSGDSYPIDRDLSLPSHSSLSSLSPDSWESTEEDLHRGLRADPSTRLIFGHDFLPDSPDDDYQEMLRTMRGFPALTLERDFWSPFVHHRLYRCSLGGMAEPLGIALACVSAHASSVGSNYGFVDRMINQERERLVRNFHESSDAPETCLAALHAVCIYQILGLFGDTFPPAALEPHSPKEAHERQREESEKAAELHISFLLKMARHLYKLHQDTLLLPHEQETDWNRWKLSESLRRNIFLVHMINILSARAHKLNEAYFEPLGDAMVLQLPLPAPECMWRACSEEEWLLAREHSLQPFLTMEAEKKPLPLGLTVSRLLEIDRTGPLDVSALLPVTRMVLACSKMAPGGMQDA
ncbi:Zn(II)2Cys6 transcription factor domain-containing protein [Aspergillus clavatus NRRL 1]|uniref:C6 zinc finger domain protein n=1 Tax=Aspergillus clavatus (strain ATCC 1007 / CBS 513.65 / DSM 816 / NCTC 3887 / NRRL 1 / QM 1276 / 107) TaxID=344612 RepID=A1CBZ5_ASPCL|nr:C6 zinc finger domain protein [Aspergillus clavatus NRRL 1]EAW13263.1 C6 zinc finger domain protein [Aspergillus clavatus NRRL 1]